MPGGGYPDSHFMQPPMWECNRQGWYTAAQTGATGSCSGVPVVYTQSLWGPAPEPKFAPPSWLTYYHASAAFPHLPLP